MKRLSLIASALAVLGLTACEKGLVEDIPNREVSGEMVNAVFSSYNPQLISNKINKHWKRHPMRALKELHRRLYMNALRRS